LSQTNWTNILVLEEQKKLAFYYKKLQKSRNKITIITNFGNKNYKNSVDQNMNKMEQNIHRGTKIIEAQISYIGE
jgi:hypothetical protein